ncbi:ribosome rescue protein RqcH [Geoglobus sp.]
MRSMSSLDISIVLREIAEDVSDLRVDKVYHHLPDEIRIKLRGRGRVDLVVEAGMRFHPTQFPKEAPRFPSSFAMLLRKHLENARLISLEQHDFDRVVVLTFERGEERRKVIAELFSKGNVILADEEYRVIMPLKHTIRVGETYRFPERRITPLDIDSADDLVSILDDREIVRVIASKLGTGGLYAEEILQRAGVDKKKKASELSGEELERIVEEMRRLFRPAELRPHIVMEGGRYLDYQPVELLRYAELEKKYFEKYWMAVDSFFSAKAVERVEERERRSEIVEKLNARLRSQIEAKERFEREVKVNRRIGDLIYENYLRIEEIHSAFLKARERRSWEEIRKVVEQQQKAGKLREIRRIIPEENAVDVEIDGLVVRLWLNKSIPEIAEEYYSRAKRFREKLDGVLRAIEKTKEELKRAEEIEERKLLSSIRVARKREWYERYRWYITSEGYLVIGGRNADMNEEIVSKHMESRDLFFHTEMPGGSATVLKNGQSAGEQSILEACQFAGIYSALWKEGKHSGEVYYVRPEQVKRAARPGEYLPKGSFFIEGRRNYVTVEMRAAIGVDLENLRLMGGPVEGVRRHCDHYVVIEIGDVDFNQFSIQVARMLVDVAKRDEKHLVRSIATPDEIARFLPPGRSRIVEAK